MTSADGHRTFIKKRGTTTVPNSTIADERLSYSALGLLLVILARPESAPQGYRAFMARGAGQDSILSAFKQMTDAGYRHQITRHAPDGRVETYTVVAEEPTPEHVAREWLEERLADEGRAWHSRARRDLRQRTREQANKAESPGGTVHGSAVHGPAVHGSPMHGPAVHGEALHKPSVSKGLSSLRSQDPEEELPSDEPSTPETAIPADFRDRLGKEA